MTSVSLWRPSPRRVYKPRKRTTTSRMMAAVRSKNNTGERLLRLKLWSLGYRYRLYRRILFGNPDLTLLRLHTVVFVDGDFWHGRGILDNGVDAFRQTLRTSRREWWVRKINDTIRRDIQVTETLRAEGWCVIRVWESDVLRDLDGTVRRVRAVLQRQARAIAKR
jgi:DNA mismatch endonuclease (patch repair protein)